MVETREITLPSGKPFTLYIEPYVPRKRSQQGRRKDREAASGSGWTAREWDELCGKYGMCLCCKSRAAKLIPDHVIPMVSGGKHEIGNIQPLCQPCNFRKGLKVIDYRLQHGRD